RVSRTPQADLREEDGEVAGEAGMNGRQVVQLHTIDQWFSVDQQVRSILLKALRVKERLWAYRLKLEQEKMELKESKWVPCSKCQQTGWCWKHPRKAGIHP